MNEKVLLVVSGHSLRTRRVLLTRIKKQKRQKTNKKGLQIITDKSDRKLLLFFGVARCGFGVALN